MERRSTTGRRLALAALWAASSSRRIPVCCVIVKVFRAERPRGSLLGYPDHDVVDGNQLNGYPDHYNQAFAFSAIFYPASHQPSSRSAFRWAEKVGLTTFRVNHEIG
jgi:hypothetical protein